MLVLAGCTCLGGPRAPESELTIRRTVDIPGYTQEQIYDEAKAWSVKKFGKRGIQRDNKKAGVLVSTAAMGYRGFWKGLLSMSSKIVKFRMKLEAEDDMFHLTFDDLRIAETNTSHHVGEYGSFSYPYKMEYPVSRQDDLDEIKPKLHEIGDKMAEAIQCLEKLPPRETVETVKTPADVPISDKDDRYTELMKLKKLLDEGIITQEEFDTEKKEILKKY
jgi:hypothetical protein